MTTQGPAVSIWHYMNEYFVDIVKEMSDGRIEITLHPGGSLFPVKDTLDNVSAGAVEMGMVGGANYGGKDPTFTAVSFLTGSSITNQDDEAIYIWTTDYVDIVSELYAKYGVKYLAPGYIPSEQFQSTVPIKSVDDFEGLKIRASGSSELLFKELGAATTYIGGGEVYTALQLGTVDAADLAGAAGNWDTGIHEVTDYIIEPCFHLTMGQLDFIINEDTWNSLTPDLQTIVQVAARAAGENFGIMIKAKNMEYRLKMIDYGLEVITLPDDDMKVIHKAALKVWDDMAKVSPEAAKLIEQYKETCKLVGKPME